MYLITLYFDEKTSKELNKWIVKVADATQNTFMTDNQVPPHMTLGAFEAPDEETAKRLFREMVFPAAGEVQLVTVGIFVPDVIYVGAVYSAYLHHLSQSMDKVLFGDKAVRIRPNYRPFSWLPHVTVGKQMTVEELRKAFAVMQESFQIRKGRIVRIGLSKPSPHRDLGSKVLL